MFPVELIKKKLTQKKNAKIFSYKNSLIHIFEMKTENYLTDKFSIWQILND